MRAVGGRRIAVADDDHVLDGRVGQIGECLCAMPTAGSKSGMSPGIMRSTMANMRSRFSPTYSQPAAPQPLLVAGPVQDAAIVLRAQGLDGLAWR